MKPFLIIGLSFLLYLTSCNQPPENKQNESLAAATEVDEAVLARGFQLLEKNCFSCHSPDADHDNRIAPPMVAIKRHYIDDNTSKEEFIAALTDFVNNPTEEKSKMPGAVRRFGLMPKMTFSEEDLKSIAEYIYTKELEAPEWFEKHYQEEHKKYGKGKQRRRRQGQGENAYYRDLGLEYAMATKAVLGKNLMQAINTKGTEGAVEFCNTKAYPLTDSMATALKAHIKRVSERNRNPENVANADELAYIEAVKLMLEQGQKPKPKVQEKDGQMLVYAPIITNQMCLQCHGDKDKDINAETLKKISSLYPEDRATGYKDNQLRGIWVVKMDKQSRD